MKNSIFIINYIISLCINMSSLLLKNYEVFLHIKLLGSARAVRRLLYKIET